LVKLCARATARKAMRSLTAGRGIYETFSWVLAVYTI
jgi:hypothetical protein